MTLGRFFMPESCVVVGVSTSPMKSGSRIVFNLLQNGYKGTIHCVNPRGGTLEILGHTFHLHARVLDVPGTPDVAIIFVRNDLIPGIVEECIDKGIQHAIIQAAGFEEIGDAGIALKERLTTITKGWTRLRVVGPNCTGITCVHEDDGNGFFSSFVPVRVRRKGLVSVISQSGMMNGGYFLYLATSTNIGFRAVAALGNKMDVNENDVLDWCATDDQTRVVALYLESISNPRGLIEAARRARQGGKLVFLLKGGVTETGKRAIMSHTGSLSGDERLVDGIVTQAGIDRSRSFHELFQKVKCADYLMESGVTLPRTGKYGMAILTVSGGAACVASDLIESHPCLRVGTLDERSREQLQGMYPSWMPVPAHAVVDLWPAIENTGSLDSTGVFRKAFDAVLGDPAIDAALITCFTGKDYPMELDVITGARDAARKPVIAWLFGDHETIDATKRHLESALVPVFDDLRVAVDALGSLVRALARNP